jgi:hypothetical protein
MNRILLTLTLICSIALLQAREYVDATYAQTSQVSRVGNDDIYFELPQFVFSHTNTSIVIKFKNPNHDKLRSNNNKLHFIVNGDDQLVEFDKNGTGTITTTFKNGDRLSVLFEDVAYNMQLPVISIWYILIPLGALLSFIVYKIVSNARQARPSSKLKVVRITQEEMAEMEV